MKAEELVLNSTSASARLSGSCISGRSSRDSMLRPASRPLSAPSSAPIAAPSSASFVGHRRAEHARRLDAAVDGLEQAVDRREHADPDLAAGDPFQRRLGVGFDWRRAAQRAREVAAHELALGRDEVRLVRGGARGRSRRSGRGASRQRRAKSMAVPWPPEPPRPCAPQRRFNRRSRRRSPTSTIDASPRFSCRTTSNSVVARSSAPSSCPAVRRAGSGRSARGALPRSSDVAQLVGRLVNPIVKEPKARPRSASPSSSPKNR